ncbi:MAG: hypothetical protein IT208_19265 [Chthonomonadales bacterium]|nr:hypothetical protein [Chthonomonadales bacterium]
MLPLLLVAMAPDLAPPPVAPAVLPTVTVRWEDAGQRDVVVVEGDRYRCRVATLPARVLSLEVDGHNVLGPGGMVLAVVDAEGRRLEPAPPDVRPAWNVWRGQSWQPATSARARMNVWSAGPYYYDAHILDIPLLSAEETAAYRTPGAPPAAVLDFTKGHEGVRGAHNVAVGRAPDGAMRLQLTGEDPYLALPPVEVTGPVRVVLRLRTRSGGGAALYWASGSDPGIDGGKVVTFPVPGDGEWHDVEVSLNDPGSITQVRFDPPGESGTVDIASVSLLRASADSRPVPLRGELVFHAQPDRLGIEVRVDPVEGKSAPGTALLTLAGTPHPADGARGRALASLERDGAGVVLLGSPGASLSGATLTLPLRGTRPSAFVAMRAATDAPPAERMADDMHPLPDGAVTLDGGHWQGYDPAAGFYVADAESNAGAFGFEPAFQNPTRRIRVGTSVRNDGRARHLLVKVMTGVGNLEAGVLTDPYGFMLPTPAFVCKNFAGELEEPDDTAFGDIYFPVSLAPNEQTRFAVEPLTHGWGIWPLKQISSIRFFLIYWHCSTGASESTCWSMDWMSTKGAVFDMPDFRPMSGPFWPGQPQHDCQHWPGWLQYNGARGRLCYERTVFDSIAPSLARFTMLYHTADGSARARVTAWEAPQRDEMRTMVRLRYDWDKPCSIEGDARRNFRWLNMSHFRGRNALLLWSGPDDATVQRAVPPQADFVGLGEPMSARAPFMASEGPSDRYGVVTLVRSFRARLGGREYDRPVLSWAFDAEDASTWLTVAAERLELQPGDYLEADVMLMPHGEPAPPGFKAERERRRSGLEPAKVTVTTGTRVADDPPQVRAEDDVAAFHVEGGHGDLPLVVDGLRGWKAPLLWTNGVWQDHQAHGGDGYQVQPDGRGGYRVTFVAPYREGQAFDYLVTRASCTGDIARVRDRNGRVELTSARPGRWELKAPAPFGPGTNHAVAGQSVIGFQGTGRSVRQLPLRINVIEGAVDVAVDTWKSARIALRTSGAVRLTIGGLRRGGRYRVTVAGQARDDVAADGSLGVDAPDAGPVTVAPR